MHVLPKLSYDYNQLEPYIDAQTMELHHSKHHQAYVDKLNTALEGTEWAEKDITEVLRSLDVLPENIRSTVRNNGGGHWNHSFFWQCMKSGGAEIEENLAGLIDSNFGDLDSFKKAFEDQAVARFGSGWVWLMKDGDKLSIISTPNQDNPIMDGESETKILLALDVWEHAYYLKYQNRRPEYIQNWWNVVDWQFVGARA